MPEIDRRPGATENESMSVSTDQVQGRAAIRTPAANGRLVQPRQEWGPPPYPIHRFTVAQYDEMGRTRILTEEDRVELLEGWIVPKMTRYPPHDGTIDLVIFLLNQLLPRGWFCRAQSAVVTRDSEPEPDVTVVRGNPGDYAKRHPCGRDVGLIVEVADSTVGRDRRKARIYARAGVPNYWIVNLDEGQIEVYGELSGKRIKADYQSKEKLSRGNQTVALVLEGKTIGKLAVAQILPRESSRRNGK
jgi:Uma2 family endonuclease